MAKATLNDRRKGISFLPNARSWRKRAVFVKNKEDAIVVLFKKNILFFSPDLERRHPLIPPSHTQLKQLDNQNESKAEAKAKEADEDFVHADEDFA